MARPLGALSKVKLEANVKAQELGIDPFEILLYFAAGRWEELGYTDSTRTIYTAEGKSYEEDVITPELRVNAAKESAQYLLAKKKAVELSLEDIPDDSFDQEVERRINLKILRGEKSG